MSTKGNISTYNAKVRRINARKACRTIIDGCLRHIINVYPKDAGNLLYRLINEYNRKYFEMEKFRHAQVEGMPTKEWRTKVDRLKAELLFEHSNTMLFQDLMQEYWKANPSGPRDRPVPRSALNQWQSASDTGNKIPGKSSSVAKKVIRHLKKIAKSSVLPKADSKYKMAKPKLPKWVTSSPAYDPNAPLDVSNLARMKSLSAKTGRIYGSKTGQ